MVESRSSIHEVDKLIVRGRGLLMSTNAVCVAGVVPKKCMVWVCYIDTLEHLHNIRHNLFPAHKVN